MQGAIDSWSYFVQDTQNLYGVDMSILTEDYCNEQTQYYANTASWTEVHPQQYVGPPTCFKEFDLLDVTLDELKVSHGTSSWSQVRFFSPQYCMSICPVFGVDLSHRGLVLNFVKVLHCSQAE